MNESLVEYQNLKNAKLMESRNRMVANTAFRRKGSTHKVLRAPSEHKPRDQQ